MTENQVQPEAAQNNEAGGNDHAQPAPVELAVADPDEGCVDCLPRSRDDDFPFTGCGCGDCDSGSIEILCQAEGIKARASYDGEHQDAPSPERYEQARLAYGQSRYAVAPRLDALETMLDDAMHEIRCRIDDQDQVDCLETSWKKVRRRLRDCLVDDCCVEDYEFRTAPKDSEVEELKARAARYAYVTSNSEQCFDRLAGEPDLLVKRVDELTAEIEAIHHTLHPEEAPAATAAATAPTSAAASAAVPPPATATAAEPGNATAVTPAEKEAVVEAAASPAPHDWPNLYAAALVARWHLKNIYWGFDDPEDYVRCLCRAMKVSMAGHQALAGLYGELRVREARWEERNKCCRRLKEHAAKEVISRYVRCIRGEPDIDEDDRAGCEECDDDNGGGDGGEDHHPRGHSGHRGGDRRRRRRDQDADDDHDDDDDDDEDDVDVDVDVRVRVEDDDDAEEDDEEDDEGDDGYGRRRGSRSSSQGRAAEDRSSGGRGRGSRGRSGGTSRR